MPPTAYAPNPGQAAGAAAASVPLSRSSPSAIRGAPAARSAATPAKNSLDGSFGQVVMRHLAAAIRCSLTKVLTPMEDEIRDGGFLRRFPDSRIQQRFTRLHHAFWKVPVLV